MATHECAASVIDEFCHIVVVPVQGRDRAIIIASIKHYEVKKLTNLECPPYAKVVIHVDLADTDTLVGKFGL